MILKTRLKYNFLFLLNYNLVAILGKWMTGLTEF